MTTQDLIVRLKGSVDKQVYTLLHITDIGECFIARLLDGDKEGTIDKVSYFNLEPVGFHPVTTKSLEETPQASTQEAQDAENVFIIGQLPAEFKTSGLYRGKRSDLEDLISKYKEDYGVEDCTVLGYLTIGGILHRLVEEMTMEELSDLLSKLVEQVKEAIKEKPEG